MSEGPISEVVRGVGEVVKMGAGNAHMRKAGDNLAQGLEIVTGLVRTALLPLAVVNARAQDYFANKFPEQLAEKLSEVPPEFVSTPKPSVAGPAMQGLNYSHEEADLRDLYLGLLATAMDSRASDSAHPAFAEIIAALSSTEVAILDVILRVRTQALVELRVITAGLEGWRPVARHVIGLRRGAAPLVDPMLPAYIDTWARLGLVTADYGVFTTGDGAYSWVETRPEYLAVQAGLQDGESMTYERGLLQVTSFGSAFARAVKITD